MYCWKKAAEKLDDLHSTLKNGSKEGSRRQDNFKIGGFYLMTSYFITFHVCQLQILQWCNNDS